MNDTVQMREFDDTDTARSNVYAGALDAVSKRFPVEDDEYRIELRNPRYTGPTEFNLTDQKHALMKDRRLQTPITGTWRLIHKPSNTVLDEREDVVMNIPYYTDRGTFINGGNEYSIVSQSRLRPGVYVRRQRTGEVEAHVNVKSGKGKPFRIHLEPSTGVFSLNINTSNIPLYPLLKAVGVSDQALAKAWGPDLVAANIKKQDSRSLAKIYQRIAGYKGDPNADEAVMTQYLRDALPMFELDPEVNERTLGLQNAGGVTPDLLMRTTQKMLGVSRDEEDPDDRDAAQFSHVYSVEDLVRERIDKDAGNLTKNLLFKVRRTKNLAPVVRSALNPYIDSLLLGSGLAMPLEETNPLHTLEQLNRITKLGEGGIGSAEAITDEARDVNPSQFGFVDPITGPEGCAHPDMEVMTRQGWVKWPDVTESTELACRIDSRIEFHKPLALHCFDHDGLMYVAQTKHFGYCVTGSHKLWSRAYDPGSDYRWERAVPAHERNRFVLTGAEFPYVGTDCAKSVVLPAVDGGNAVKNELALVAEADWYEFLGWYVSEGSCGIRGDGNHWVAIAQHDPDNQRRIRALLDRMPFPFHDQRQHGALHGFMCVRKQLWAEVVGLGHSNDKHLPEYVFEASVEARTALLQALCAGDGRKKGQTYAYCTSSRALALQVERLAFGLGYSVRVRFEPDARPQSRTGGCWCVHLHLARERCLLKNKGHFSTFHYEGKVYCATVPGSLLYMRYGEHGGHWTGNLNIGIDVRTSYRTFKGADNRLYAEFNDARTGKTVRVRPDQAADSVVAFPGQDLSGGVVYAMKRGKVQRVPAKEVDYQVPSFAHMMSSHTNLNPMPTSVQPGRQFYGAKFWSQYMPQVQGEVPLVDSLMPDGRMTFTEYYGRKAGTLKAKQGGTVTKVSDNSVTVTDDNGKKHVYDLAKDFPFNRMTGISYFPAVEVGQKVVQGDMVAHSNFTDKKSGALNMGRNLKTAIIPYKGNSYEDAYVISESAAQKLATERLYGFDVDARHGVELGRSRFISAFPKAFTQEQVDTLDEHGVVKPGTVLHKGDPIMLAVGPKLLTSADAQLGKLHKVLRGSFTDKSQTWEYSWPGTVTDVAMVRHGAKVNIKSTPPVSVGDKLSTRFGLKGVVGKIVPDEQMPRDVGTNEPYELLLNPMAVLSRVAPNQIMEMSLGKLAHTTGRQIRLPQHPPKEGWAQWTKTMLDESQVPEAADLFDPDTGKTVKNIGDGRVYVSAFHHLAEKKLSSRGDVGSYTADEQPARGGHTGAKKFSQMDVNAALAHGATDVIKDVVTIRGTKNEEFWKALKLGRPLPEPKVPFIYNKFLDTLRAGGINVVEKGDITGLLPMTDDDITAMSKGEIEKSDLVDDSFEPMPGGLFDAGRTGGTSGNRWTHINLPEPVPNPVMEEPVRRLLGLKVQQLEDILAGREKLDGKTGGGAIKAALEKIDIDDMIQEHKQRVRTTRGSNRDNSIKVLGYLTAAKQQGVHPSKWMISKVPVLPPVFRPVSRMGDVALVADLNELYRDVLETAKSYRDMKGQVPDEELADERLNLYKSVTAAFGLGDPITPEGQSKRLKGAIRQVIGTSPKFGMFQSKVISKPVDVVGRGVVTPDPNLDMDQIGIPEDSAWELYKDFTLRELVRHGYPTTAAVEMIDRRSKEALDTLKAEMRKRPVIMDRAPTWHKFNLLAFYPHITEGHTIRVSPLVTKGFNMDFDGDQANFHVPVSDKAVEQTKRRMLPSDNLFSLTDLKSVRHSPSMEMTMGLYWLTRPANTKKPVRRFRTERDAEEAYRHGELGANDPIEIG